MNVLRPLLKMPGGSAIKGGLFGAWRTLFTRPQLPSIFNSSPRPTSIFGIGGGAVKSGSRLLAPFEGLLGAVNGRTNVRNHFPKASEVKRIKCHGWKTRMATLQGRRILMRRILKGRHVYSH